MKLGLPESVILKAAALVYLLPLLGLFVGAVLGQFIGNLIPFNPDLSAMVFAAFGTMLFWWFGKQRAKRLEVAAKPMILAYLGMGVSFGTLTK